MKVWAWIAAFCILVPLEAVEKELSGRALFEAKCVQCHALPDPESLNPQQWQAVLKTMQRRMREAKQVELTAEEIQKLTCFLSDKASQGTCNSRKHRN